MTTPWPHQIEARDLAIANPGFLLSHGMGSGKTYTTVLIIDKLNLQRILIFCPKSVIQTWVDEFEKHLPGKYKIFAPNKGTVTKKSEQVLEFMRDQYRWKNPAIVVLNYEAAWRSPMGPDYEKNKLVNKGVLMSIPWEMVVADECHRLASPKSNISWFATRIGAQIERRIGLTGTVLPNNALNAYAQYRFLDPRVFGKSFTLFKKKYAVMGGYENKQFLGLKREMEADFHCKLYSIAHHVKVDDVIQLPDVQHLTREAVLEPAGRKIYDQLQADFVAKVGTGEISATNAMVKLLRLQQIAGGYAQPDDGIPGVIVDNEKILVAKELFEDIPIDEPVVVFCVFRNEIIRLRQAAESTGRTTGELSGKRNDLAEWKRGELNTLIVQMRSGGVGIDLSRSRYCIYFSTGFSLGDYEQSLARTRRPGAKLNKKIFYYHIVAKDTVDEKVFTAIQKKKKAVDYILDDIKQTFAPRNQQQERAA